MVLDVKFSCIPMQKRDKKHNWGRVKKLPCVVTKNVSREENTKIIAKGAISRSSAPTHTAVFLIIFSGLRLPIIFARTNTIFEMMEPIRISNYNSSIGNLRHKLNPVMAIITDAKILNNPQGNRTRQAYKAKRNS